MELQNWQDISENYGDALLLGNGASIAIDERFRYFALYEKARTLGTINSQVNDLFERFSTEDFERVLWKLVQAKDVNQILEMATQGIDDAYEQIKNSLLKTVKRIHPEQADVADRLAPMADAMSGFKSVFVMNYDVLAYWAYLAYNQQHEISHFKDCWINSSFREDWDSLREPIGGATAATLVFYPHGNLVLCGDVAGNEKKIVRSNDPLLEQIEAEWESGGSWPLFVSEGSSAHKLATINKSAYLRAVLQEALPQAKESLAIFGWSMGPGDAHILEALAPAGLKRVAVSYHARPGDDFSLYRDRAAMQLHAALGAGVTVEFFDSISMISIT